MKIGKFQRSMLLGLAVSLAVGLGGCATSDGGSDSASSSPSADASNGDASFAVPVPASSPLAKIEKEMSEQQVRKAIGEPDDIRHFPTGKNFIPFYFGGDTRRSEWIYKGVGQVVFSNPSRWTRGMKVIGVRHNPAE